jgi:hypothetical protein
MLWNLCGRFGTGGTNPSKKFGSRFRHCFGIASFRAYNSLERKVRGLGEKLWLCKHGSQHLNYSPRVQLKALKQIWLEASSC